MSEGLKLKYNVTKVEDGTPVYDCFVLRPQKDPAARAALRTYAETTNNDELRKDIHGWINDIESALRAQEQNEPQCRDCKHLGKAWACDNCTYDRELRDRTSYYEPKGADHE